MLAAADVFFVPGRAGLLASGATGRGRVCAEAMLGAAARDADTTGAILPVDGGISGTARPRTFGQA